MEITNGEIVINRTIDREKKKKRKKENVEKLLVRVRKLQRGQRVFRAKRVFSPSRFHASLSIVYDALITYPVDRSAIEFDLSLAREGGKKKGGRSWKVFFPPRPYFFPLCSILEGIVLKISWHWRDTRSWLISRPTLLHPIDNGTLNRLLPFYDPLPQLLDRTYVPLTFFLITPINFSSVGTEDIPLVE